MSQKPLPVRRFSGTSKRCCQVHLTFFISVKNRFRDQSTDTTSA